jgi:hypothetical protein
MAEPDDFGCFYFGIGDTAVKMWCNPTDVEGYRGFRIDLSSQGFRSGFNGMLMPRELEALRNFFVKHSVGPNALTASFVLTEGQIEWHLRPSDQDLQRVLIIRVRPLGHDGPFLQDSGVATPEGFGRLARQLDDILKYLP